MAICQVAASGNWDAIPTSRGCISIYEAAWQALLPFLALCHRAPPLGSVTSRDTSSILPKDRDM